MNISIIGSGNVAWHLAMALKASGNNILQITGRNENAVNEIAANVSAKPNYSFQKIDTENDLILLCVKDDAIEQVAKLLPKTSAILAHTSGFRSKDSLAECSKKYGVFYPLQTMKKGVKIPFVTVPFLIEGNSEEVTNSLSSIAAQLSNSVHTVNELQRQYIHIAAVFANNFTNHLYELAENILSSQNLSLDLLRPLMAQSAENVQQFSPSKLQTGPAARKDFFTIEAHLKLLSSDEEMTKVYRIITESILRSKLD